MNKQKRKNVIIGSVASVIGLLIIGVLIQTYPDLVKTQTAPTSTGACVTKSLPKTCLDTTSSNCNLTLNTFTPNTTCVALGILPPIDADGCDSTLKGTPPNQSPAWQTLAGPLPSGKCRYCRTNQGGFEGPHISKYCKDNNLTCLPPQPLPSGVSIEPNNRYTLSNCVAPASATTPPPASAPSSSSFCGPQETVCTVGISSTCCLNGVSACNTSGSLPVCVPVLQS